MKPHITRLSPYCWRMSNWLDRETGDPMIAQYNGIWPMARRYFRHIWHERAMR